MEHRNQLELLIVRSFTEALVADEELLLHDWILAAPENRAYYDTLRDTWRLMLVMRDNERIDLATEWSQFLLVSRNAGRDGETLGANEKTPQHRPFVYRLLPAAGVAAACILLALGAGWWFLSGSSRVPGMVVQAPEKAATVPIRVARREVNPAGPVKRLIMPDGSEVLLSAGSELRWEEPFSDKGRELVLSGEASFKVVRDSGRPFRVSSGAISTTVLGTAFRVTAYEQARTAMVRLYEGSVLVRARDSLHPLAAKEKILSPGQELVYDKRRLTMWLRSFEGPYPGGTVKREAGSSDADSLSVPGGDTRPWYMFNNQSLAQVFNQLQEIYGVQIKYSRKDVARLYFIGRFEKTDSVEVILKQIAALNNLRITRDHNIYIIRR